MHLELRSLQTRAWSDAKAAAQICTSVFANNSFIKTYLQGFVTFHFSLSCIYGSIYTEGILASHTKLVLVVTMKMFFSSKHITNENTAWTGSTKANVSYPVSAFP